MGSKTLALSLGALALAGTAFAQQPAKLQLAKSELWGSESAAYMLESRVTEVSVPLAVTDRLGRPVSRITADDLQVLENGRPASITELRRDEDPPLRLALVVDWSDSVQRDLKFERKVALDFLRSTLRPEVDEAAVVGFGYRVEVSQPLTGNFGNLEAALRPVGGAPLSSVYDALIAATEQLRQADDALPQRRAIMLLSDGKDNASAHGPSDVIQAAQRANIAIYAITPQPRRAKPASERALMQMSRMTGGCVFSIAPAGEQAAFARIEQDLRVGYALYFKPGAQGESFRSLEIVARDPNLQVRARRGFYAGW